LNHVVEVTEKSTHKTLDLIDQCRQVVDSLPMSELSLESLESLHLGENEVGDDGAKALGSLQSLRSLHLDRNEVGDEGARALSSLVDLTELVLSDNSIGDEGVEALASLTELASLHLEENEIGDAGAHALVLLTNLTTVHLEGNAITDASIFRSMPWLEFLCLDHNPLRKIFLELIGSKDCLPELTAYWQDLDAGATLNDFVRVLVAGNSGVGKTTLGHWMALGPPPPQASGDHAHGPRLRRVELTLPRGDHVELRLMELEDETFGGEPPIVLLLWARGTHDVLDEASSLLCLESAIADGRVVLVETRIDRPHDPTRSPVVPGYDLGGLPRVAVSAVTGANLDGLMSVLVQVVEAARDCWAYPIPTSWRAVGAALEAWRDPAAHGLDQAPRTRIRRAQFEQLCSRYGIASPAVVRSFLESVNVIFRDHRDFDAIVLDP